MGPKLFDNLHHGLGHVLDLRSTQHALTASNLANADTPGFKAKHIPFDRLLTDVVERGEAPRTPDIHEAEAPPWSLDGNSVVAEREMVRLSENATLYSGVSRGLSRRLAMLRFAASDGRTG